MGTNYYLHTKTEPPCPTCGHAVIDTPLHIGKSSAGWCFAVHVDPNLGIRSLDDWIKRWNQPGAVIRDEYREEVTPERMLEIITKRSARAKPNWTPDMLARNSAMGGPNNLLRSVSPGCEGYGDGTWDYIEGEFS